MKEKSLMVRFKAPGDAETAKKIADNAGITNHIYLKGQSCCIYYPPVEDEVKGSVWSYTSDPSLLSWDVEVSLDDFAKAVSLKLLVEETEKDEVDKKVEEILDGLEEETEVADDFGVLPKEEDFDLLLKLATDRDGVRKKELAKHFIIAALQGGAKMEEKMAFEALSLARDFENKAEGFFETDTEPKSCTQ